MRSYNEKLVNYCFAIMGDYFDKNNSELRKSLIEMAKSDNVNFRILAVGYLNEYKDPEIYDLLVKLIENDPNIEVRRSSIIGLGNWGDKRTIVYLARGPLKNGTIREKYAVLQSLDRMLHRSNNSANLLNNIERELIEALDNDNPYFKYTILDILHNYSGTSVISKIKPLLKDPDDSVRNATKRAIEEIKKRHKASIQSSPSPTPSPTSSPTPSP